MAFINIGFGNIINSDKILVMVTPDSAPSKRIVQKAKERECIVDATQGRRTKSVIITSDDHVVLSALVPETIASRMKSESIKETENEN